MKRTIIGLLVLSLVGFGLAMVTAGRSARPAERTFEFTYVAQVQEIPEGAERVEIWLPYAVSDPHQEIQEVRVSAPGETRIFRDSEYGNSILHLAVTDPPSGTLRTEMTFRVRRKEYLRHDVVKAAANGNGSRQQADPSLRRWLSPDRRVPIDERIRRLALEVTAGKQTDLEKARAIYDYVVSTMRYDKSGTGWGNGDIYWACDAKRGNCTDFHALFIGLCRAVGIPAKFAIGFPLPAERGAGEIGGYHCWAEFYLQGYGWIPVDTSEANKHPEKREYFFGAHDENRVEFTVGRDLVLEPPQAGDPLNYFIYPYVEVDGKPFSQVEKQFTYRDVSS